MTATLFRKTLLTLAVAAAAFPVNAQIVQLTNSGFSSQMANPQENLEFNGHYDGSEPTAIHVASSNIKNLTLNSTINTAGEYSSAVFLGPDWKNGIWGYN